MTRSGTAAGLDYDIAVAEGAADGALVAVLLHGRGSHKGDLQALAPVLPESWTIVTPQAPNPGAEWGYGGGWAWYRYLEEDRLEHATLERSLELLDGFLAELPAIVGFEPGRRVLGGFSQGGTVSVSYAMTRPGSVTAALNFSGFLPASIELPDSGENATPIFWGHGGVDPNVPIHLGHGGQERLQAAGVPLVWMEYPMGHWMVPEEVHDAVAMVESIP